MARAIAAATLAFLSSTAVLLGSAISAESAGLACCAFFALALAIAAFILAFLSSTTSFVSVEVVVVSADNDFLAFARAIAAATCAFLS